MEELTTELGIQREEIYQAAEHAPRDRACSVEVVF